MGARINFILFWISVFVVLGIVLYVVVKRQEKLTYSQYLEPEDKQRMYQYDNTGTSTSGCGCGVGAEGLSETEYFMGDSRCNIKPSRQFEDDPGYFLGKNVI